MGHDDAVSALESLPEIARIPVLRLRQMESGWPENKVRVFEEGMSIKVVEGSA